MRAYCPVGDLVAGMAYLVRRLLENTANESFLHEQARRRRRVEELLARAREPPFANEPELELRRAPVREALTEALRAPRRAGCRSRCRSWFGDDAGAATGFDSTDPGKPERVVATRGARDGARTSSAAVEAARPRRRASGARAGGASGPRSSCAPPTLLRDRRLELAALEVRECAKPWAEADADVCEAIDFLEYYAREAVELERGPRAAPGAAASATRCATCRAGWPR